MKRRCVVCGRIPTEACCVQCHAAHDWHNKPLFDASHVRAAIQVTGDSRSQFAKRVGVSPSAVDGWFYKGWHPNAEAAKTILGILETKDVR